MATPIVRDKPDRRPQSSTPSSTKGEKEIRAVGGLVRLLRAGRQRFAESRSCPSGNFRPSWWHVRDYGLMVANPFARKALGKGEPSQVIVQPGEPFKLRWVIFLHSGPTEESVDIGRPAATALIC